MHLKLVVEHITSILFRMQLLKLHRKKLWFVDDDQASHLFWCKFETVGIFHKDHQWWSPLCQSKFKPINKYLPEMWFLPTSPWAKITACHHHIVAMWIGYISSALFLTKADHAVYGIEHCVAFTVWAIQIVWLKQFCMLCWFLMPWLLSS